MRKSSQLLEVTPSLLPSPDRGAFTVAFRPNGTPWFYATDAALVQCTAIQHWDRLALDDLCVRGVTDDQMQRLVRGSCPPVNLDEVVTLSGILRRGGAAVAA